MSTIHVRPAGPIMDGIRDDRMTHKVLEDRVMADFKQSPDYSIGNVRGYPMHRGHMPITGAPIVIPGLKVIASPINPLDKNNNIIRRLGRFMGEKLYITHCGLADKFSTAAILVGAILAIIVMYKTVPLNVEQIYKFTDPNDANDKAKQAQLDDLNNAYTGSTYVLSKAALIAIPGILTAWQIFKRTTVHAPGFEQQVNLTSVFRRALPGRNRTAIAG